MATSVWIDPKRELEGSGLNRRALGRTPCKRNPTPSPEPKEPTVIYGGVLTTILVILLIIFLAKRV